MRRRSLIRLGETEMEVLHHVWEMGEASVADVHDGIVKTRPVAYTTVMTVMKKLARKGFLHCDSSGSRYLYTPARPPAQVREELLQTSSTRSSKVGGGVGADPGTGRCVVGRGEHGDTEAAGTHGARGGRGCLS